jgi:hypothetical protein
MVILPSVIVEDSGLLRLTTRDGLEGTVSLNEPAQHGGVLTRLADPSYREAAALGEEGRFVVWLDDLDLCADALWITADVRRVAVA